MRLLNSREGAEANCSFDGTLNFVARGARLTVLLIASISCWCGFRASPSCRENKDMRILNAVTDDAVQPGKELNKGGLNGSGKQCEG